LVTAQSTVLANVRAVVIHAKDEAAVDHDPQAAQPPGDLGIVLCEVLLLVAGPEVLGTEGLELDKKAPKSRLGGPLDQIAPQNRINCGGPLEEPAHPLHSLKQFSREPAVA
jgi:hypothetical protein